MTITIHAWERDARRLVLRGLNTVHVLIEHREAGCRALRAWGTMFERFADSRAAHAWAIREAERLDGTRCTRCGALGCIEDLRTGKFCADCARELGEKGRP